MMNEPKTRNEEWQKEQVFFSETLEIALQERQKVEADLGIEDGNDRFVQVLDDGSGDALVQQFLLRSKLRSLHQLRLSGKSPYFARLDFTPLKEQEAGYLSGLRLGEQSSVYLGRWGVVKTPEYKLRVADWRSPVANLYYSGQLGAVHYEAPDGPVHGELSLKRMFTVEDGKLLAMQDTGILGQEKYLTDALSQVTTARLREVVTTIQAEQNVVIRHDPYAPLCVQGVAGSGKTTIALHRIAWILYRLQKTLSPRQLLILAPNPLFLNYISRVLPDLGVDDTRQMTFVQLCNRWLGKRMPKLAQRARLEERLSMAKPARDALDDMLRRKGSLALGAALDRFLLAFEASAVPKDDLCFGGRTLLTAAEMKDFFLRQFRHFPLEARMREVRKVASVQLKKRGEEIRDALHKAVDEKLDALLRALPDGEERRRKASALLSAREERLSQLKEAQAACLKALDALWPSMDLLTVYALFWQDMADQDSENQATWEATHTLLCKKQIAAEDLPALICLAERLYGLPKWDIRHVVIDEAQDVSPLQVKVLRKIFGHDAFTLVGDLWQGVYGDEGIRSWDALSEGIFEMKPEIATLSTSYRSTVEIMEFALRAMQRHPAAGVLPGKPVLRHGDKPFWTPVSSEQARREEIVRAIHSWQEEGFYSMAIIVKEESKASALHRDLLRELPTARLVTQGDEHFEGGVLVMGASMVKGLEFDCVLIADGEAAVYPDERFYAKLFYVLCTRPLHRLRLLSLGEETLLSKPV